MSQTASTVSDRLKEATAELHRTAERHAFQERLASGDFSREDYVRYLGQFLLVHRRLESHLRSSNVPVFRTVIRDYQYQERYILDDLAFFGVDVSQITALPATASLLDEIDRAAAEHPIGLLGYHYVLEGSNNGSRFIAASLRKVWSLPDNRGTRYLDPYGDLQKTRWRAFREDLAAAQLTDEEQNQIISAAKSMFVAIIAIFDDLTAGSSAA